MRLLHRHPATPPKLPARIAVAGMSLAVVALGALAVWAGIVTQNGADGLSRAGVQTSGHLRAVQALSMIDTSTDALEERIVPSELARLRRAQGVLHEALHRMEHGGNPEASRIAGRAAPIVQRMNPAIERFLAEPPGFDSNGTEGAEEEMENTMGELEVLLNDLDPDPSRLLVAKLESVTATEDAVRVAAFVLVPLGLVGVAVCAWLLGLYRRRSENAMRASLDATAREARTDALTGLPNRRALLEELERRSDANQSFILTLADLDGFKRYNDTYGHPAGDQLLRRLGRKLAAACEGRGIAARLGGDEFCVLFSGAVSADDAHAIVLEALSEEGDGFRISAASGAVAVPEEARDPSAAMQLADTRMYAAKARARPVTELWGLSRALTLMLDARHPGLGSHGAEVARLAVACAETLGQSQAVVESVGRAAELHDIGKVAIPSAILGKQGPLNDEEREFVHRHSAIGERILAGIPSLESVASMVRSSHERWDGTGYPDRLAGEEIPLGARIVHVADALCAMTEGRPYARAQSLEDSRQELRACSGTQFDPAAVTALLAVLDGRSTRADAQAPVAVALPL